MGSAPGTMQALALTGHSYIILVGQTGIELLEIHLFLLPECWIKGGCHHTWPYILFLCECMCWQCTCGDQKTTCGFSLAVLALAIELRVS